MDEIAKINTAIDEFASDIKERMAEKYGKGYRGWDGEYPAAELLGELADDVKDVRQNAQVKKYAATRRNVLLKRLVDIGARTMMLWYRQKS